MYRIMCSYPHPHVCKGGLPELSDAIEFFCDADLAGQTDEQNYYWTEVECLKHGWQPLTFDSMCQECDREADHSLEQVEPLTDAELDEIYEYEQIQMDEKQGGDFTE